MNRANITLSILWAFVACLLPEMALAQLQISQLIVQNPPSSYISDYENNPNAIVLGVSN